MKTPEQVIAGHQRKLANISAHLAGVINKNANQRHHIKELEDLLVWIHRRTPPITVVEFEGIRDAIEHRIPNRLLQAGE